MAIKPTPNNNMFKSLVFDGVDSRDYGIYITGDAVFNSPERDVEMIEIPGRNGAYALDKGRFSNIKVSYPAGIAGDTEADFREGISAFRNALASRKGYKRLEDDYNPDEYRMAVYKSGLEVTPKALKAGEFTITFDCQPQRFLKSGETAVSVESGDTITNPTLFESRPLVRVEGYGELSIGDADITLYSAELGRIDMPAKRTQQSFTYSQYVNNVYDTEVFTTDFLNNGDKFYWNGGQYYFPFSIANNEYVNSSSGGFDGRITTPGTYIEPSATPRIDATDWTTSRYYVGATILTPIEFTFGTAKTVTDSAVIDVTYTTDNGNTYTRTVTVAMNLTYTGLNNIGLSIRATNSADGAARYNTADDYFGTAPTFYGISTQTPGDLYIDADIGEAYFVAGDAILNANNYVYFVTDLPVLAPGENAVEYTGNITEVEITPRWWEV